MKILDKSLWGSGEGITVINKKANADMTSSSHIDPIAVLNEILMASNYEALISEAYYTVGENWKENLSELAGLHHVVQDGVLVLNHGKCKGLLVQHEHDTTSNVNHIERHCKALSINMTKQKHSKHLLEGESIKENRFVIREFVELENCIEEEFKPKIKEAFTGEKVYVLRPTIRAIGAGKTANNHRYLSKYLQGDPECKPYPTGIYSYLEPYNKPILLNHNTYFGEPLGRVIEARYLVESDGVGAVYIMPEITDKDAIEKIIDKRYLTVSVGSTTDSVVCNICGVDLMEEGFCLHDRFTKFDEVECKRIHGACNICGAEGSCEHTIGKKYDSVEAEWILGQLWFDECSFVNVPADAEAGVIDVGESDHQPMEAYLEFDNELYNINHESEKAHANVFGMAVKEFKEGGLSHNMDKDLETLTNQVEELTTERDQLSEQVTSLTSTHSDEKAALDSTIAELTATNEALTAEKDSLIQERDTLSADKDTLVAERDALSTDKESLAEEKKTLAEENIELVMKAHKMLAERVVDMKIALKEDVEREAELQILIDKEDNELQELFNSSLETFNEYDFKANLIDNPAGTDEEQPIQISEEDKKVVEFFSMFSSDYQSKNNQRSEK